MATEQVPAQLLDWGSISSLGVGAVFGALVLLYVARTLIPRMFSMFESSIEKSDAALSRLVAEFRAETREQRETFQAEMQHQRESFDKAIARLPGH